MEKGHMKRVNVILETDLYDKARVVAFVKKKSLSAIVRNALREWLSVNIDAEAALITLRKGRTAAFADPDDRRIHPD